MAAFTVTLHEKQKFLFQETNALFIVCVAGRRFGKTYAAAYKCIIEGLRNHNGRLALDDSSEVMYIAPTLEQAKAIFWPVLQKLARPVTKKDKTGALMIHQNSAVLTLKNGVRIRLRGADNPDRCRGFKLRYCVLDEYADMPGEMWEEIILPALSDCEGGALFIGTPKGRNHFYKLYLLGQDPNDVDHVSYNFSSHDNPYLTEAALARMTRNMSEENRRQEVMASFISGGSKYIPVDKIKILDRMPDLEMRWGITVDPAGFVKARGGKKIVKRDNCVITVGAHHPEGLFLKEQIIGQWGPRETANKIVLACRQNPYAKLGIEQGALLNAMGEYLDSYMKEYHTYRTVQPLKHGNTHKWDRIEASLAPLAQKGRLYLIRGGWNDQFIDEASVFPDPLAHDDCIDSAAYQTQLVSSVGDFGLDLEEDTYFETLDVEAGY